MGSSATVSQTQALFVRMIDKALQRPECEVGKKNLLLNSNSRANRGEKVVAALQVFPVSTAFLWAKCAYSLAKQLMKYQSGLLKVKC